MRRRRRGMVGRLVTRSELDTESAKSRKKRIGGCGVRAAFAARPRWRLILFFDSASAREQRDEIGDHGQEEQRHGAECERLPCLG